MSNKSTNKSQPKTTKSSNKSSVTTTKPKIRHLGLKLLFGIPALIILALLGFELFKEIATRRDIKQLDQAEAKMRQLDIANIEGVEFYRNCSERSVKYGSPGRPNCRVGFTIMDSGRTIDFESMILNTDFDISEAYIDSDRRYFNIQNFINNLSCQAGDLDINIPNSIEKDRKIIFYCQKKFWKKAYPVR